MEFQNSNIKSTKDELFDFLIFEFIFYFDICLNYSNILNIYIVYKNVDSWNFNVFPNCSIFKICYSSKLNNLKNFMFFEIGIFGKFLEFYKLDIFDFSKLDIFRIFQIDNFWNFPRWKFKKVSKLKFFWISQIANFSNFPYWKFFEISTFEVFGINQIEKLRNFKIFFNLENQRLAKKIRNFANSYTCPLILINFDALTSQLLFHILLEIFYIDKFIK